MHSTFVCTLTAAVLTVALRAQNSLVVPTLHATLDALSYEWIAGATDSHRQQTLVGSSHLGAMQGQYIQVIELRRTAVAEAYLAGSANMTVRLSTSPNAPLACSNAFADNIGANVVQCFSGAVTLPASPATGSAGTAVAWTPDNTVRIELTVPFLYQGGTLCIDVTGQPIAGQQTWWMADAAEEVVSGSHAIEIGTGCGVYGGPLHQWSQVQARSLVVGGYGVFRAQGAANTVALAMFGAPSAGPIPLSLFGIPTPGCNCHLDPLQPILMIPAFFELEPQAFAGTPAMAEVLVPLPAVPQALGFQMTTQWFDLAQMAVSNAISWQVANATPTLDMALVEGNPAGAVGTVTTYLAHVLRFEYQ